MCVCPPTAPKSRPAPPLPARHRPMTSAPALRPRPARPDQPSPPGPARPRPAPRRPHGVSEPTPPVRPSAASSVGPRARISVSREFCVKTCPRRVREKLREKLRENCVIFSPSCVSLLRYKYPRRIHTRFFLSTQACRARCGPGKHPPANTAPRQCESAAVERCAANDCVALFYCGRPLIRRWLRTSANSRDRADLLYTPEELAGGMCGQCHKFRRLCILCHMALGQLDAHLHLPGDLEVKEPLHAMAPCPR